jgi:ribonuclease HI
MQVVKIYTDGACSGNPGPGGYAALIIFPDGQEKIIQGAEAATTNNRMELLAAVSGLQALPEKSKVCVVTDSQYVKLGMTQWVHQWQRNAWRTASKSPVKNVDLWQALLAAAGAHDVHWEWVRGHSGHPENERVDYLARTAMLEL